MSTRETVAIRTFSDRAEALGHFVIRAGESPRFLAFDDVAGCPVLPPSNGPGWWGSCWTMTCCMPPG